jgi:hypothetical protein
MENKGKFIDVENDSSNLQWFVFSRVIWKRTLEETADGNRFSQF